MRSAVGVFRYFILKEIYSLVKTLEVLSTTFVGMSMKTLEKDEEEKERIIT